MTGAVTPLRRRPRKIRRFSGVGWYIASRIVGGVLTLAASTFLVFSSLYLAGDPISALSRGKTLTPALEAALREQYRLDDPFLERFGRWVVDLVHGDLGKSLMYKDDVTNIIGERIGVTFQLVAYAGILIIVLGIGCGVVAGLRDGFVDSAIRGATTVLMAIPPFVYAIALLAVFAAGLGWFPTRGEGEGFLDRTWHLTLPAFALSLASLSIVSQVTRAAVRMERSSEHVQTAISRGFTYGATVRRHIVRNAMIPILTVTGVTVASLVAFTAIVEQAFGINGLGSALVQAASSNDFPVVQGIAIIYVLVFVIVNTLVDLSYGLLDPRLRFGGEK